MYYINIIHILNNINNEQYNENVFSDIGLTVYRICSLLISSFVLWKRI